MKKINELFYSLQGEGFNCGTPAVFIRFSGCNLQCPFCDTQHNTGKWMDDTAIVTEVMKYPAPLIVLTGGEPTLFIDEPFIKALLVTGKKIAIETNGTCPLKLSEETRKQIWITISPKDFLEGSKAPILMQECDELKVVNVGQELSHYFDMKAHHYFLQPCDFGDAKKNQENLQMTIESCLQDTRWRLSLQTHKMIGIR